MHHSEEIAALRRRDETVAEGNRPGALSGVLFFPIGHRPGSFASQARREQELLDGAAAAEAQSAHASETSRRPGHRRALGSPSSPRSGSGMGEAPRQFAQSSEGTCGDEWQVKDQVEDSPSCFRPPDRTTSQTPGRVGGRSKTRRPDNEIVSNFQVNQFLKDTLAEAVTTSVD